MSEFSRKLDHHNGEAILKIYRRAFPDDNVYCIAQRDAWMYSRDHNPDFVPFMMLQTIRAYNSLGMGGVHIGRRVLKRRMADLACIIEEGIDDLIHAKAAPEEKRPVVGEAVIGIDGRKHTVELRG